MAIANARTIAVRTIRIKGTGAVSGSANNLFTLAIATTLTGVSVQGFANVFVSDGTDAQSRSASFALDGVNKAGTLTVAGTITGASNVAASSGTLTVTATPGTSGTTFQAQITPTTSLTATTHEIIIIAWLLRTTSVVTYV